MINTSSVLPESKKLTVIVRVEAGCLGPEGASHVDAFCQEAMAEISQVDKHFVNWKMVPRHDRSLPEFEYLVNDKGLDQDKVDRYLSLFDRNLDDFESDLNSYLITMIEQYLSTH